MRYRRGGRNRPKIFENFFPLSTWISLLLALFSNLFVASFVWCVSSSAGYSCSRFYCLTFFVFYFTWWTLFHVLHAIIAVEHIGLRHLHCTLPAFTLKWHLLVGPIAAPLRHPGVAEGGNNTKSPDFRGSLLLTSFVCIPGSLDSHTDTPSQDQTDGFQQSWCTHQDRIDYFLSILFPLSFFSPNV